MPRFASNITAQTYRPYDARGGKGAESANRFASPVDAAAVLVLVGGVAQADDPESRAVIECRDGRTIDAAFVAAKVDRMLSDVRSLSLPKTVSRPGIRYADADDGFLFWR